MISAVPYKSGHPMDDDASRRVRDRGVAAQLA